MCVLPAKVYIRFVAYQLRTNTRTVSWSKPITRRKSWSDEPRSSIGELNWFQAGLYRMWILLRVLWVLCIFRSKWHLFVLFFLANHYYSYEAIAPNPSTRYIYIYELDARVKHLSKPNCDAISQHSTISNYIYARLRHTTDGVTVVFVLYLLRSVELYISWIGCRKLCLGMRRLRVVSWLWLIWKASTTSHPGSAHRAASLVRWSMDNNLMGLRNYPYKSYIYIE